MTKPICGYICVVEGRRMICRRSLGHEGDCSFSTFRAKSLRPRRRLRPLLHELMMQVDQAQQSIWAAQDYLRRNPTPSRNKILLAEKLKQILGGRDG